jgi:L-alanine-DL-glutamate epimerase-like enolase superfamily enzyme
MKIKKIETVPFEADRLSQLLVRITTDEGLEGIGEAWVWGYE